MHADVLWDELDEADRKLIESKPVNHYIVWRVVFKQSISKPQDPMGTLPLAHRGAPQHQGRGYLLHILIFAEKMRTT